MEDEGPTECSKAHLNLGRGIGAEVGHIAFVGPHLTRPLAVHFGDLV